MRFYSDCTKDDKKDAQSITREGTESKSEQKIRDRENDETNETRC